MMSKKNRHVLFDVKRSIFETVIYFMLDTPTTVGLPQRPETRAPSLNNDAVPNNFDCYIKFTSSRQLQKLESWRFCEFFPSTWNKRSSAVYMLAVMTQRLCLD